MAVQSAPDHKQARNAKFVWQDAFASAGLRPASIGFIGYVMANKDNGDGKGFYASAEHLAALTGMNLRTVQRAIRELLKTGWIEQSQRGGLDANGKGVASRYKLTIPATTDVSLPMAVEVEEPRLSPPTTDVSSLWLANDKMAVRVDPPVSRPDVDPSRPSSGVWAEARAMAGAERQREGDDSSSCSGCDSCSNTGELRYEDSPFHRPITCHR